MHTWYVRSRGRVMGPFRTEELKALRATRQLQGYDEVSQDQVTWTAADLCEVFAPPAAPAAPPPADPAAGPASPFAVPPPARKRGPALGWLTPVRLIIGGVVLSIVLLTLIGVLIARGDRWRGSAGPGPIRFDDRTSAADRDRVLAESVGLVVAGTTFTWPDGSQHDRGAIHLKPDGGLEDRGLVAGTGFVVTRDGHLVTNRHVVQSVVEQKRAPARLTAEAKHSVKIEPKLWVFFGKDRKFEAEVAHVSENFDLAVLRTNRPGLRYFALCDRKEDDIPRLPAVSAVGYPAVDRQPVGSKDQLDKLVRDKSAGPIQFAFPDTAFDLSERDGRVNKAAFRTQIDPNPGEVYVLQHSAELFAGNSGGPLLVKSGLVVGINTWKRTEAVKDARGKVVEVADRNINYALTLPQLRGEIERAAPGTTWEPLPE